MSVSTLQSTASINIQRTSINAEGKEAGFLTFNYLNKHARVRVSPQPLDISGVPGKANFLVVSNSHDWFAAVTRSATNDLQLSCSPLSHLQQAFSSNPPAGVEEISFEPQRTLIISGTPNLLSLACNDTRLLISFTHGPILVYDCSQLFTPGTDELTPAHTFPGSLPCQQMEPNPGDMPDLVAVFREGDNPPVQVLNVQTFVPVCGWNSGGTPESTPCALSWSPRGKQLAVALQSGDIVTYSPTTSDSPKATIPKPQSMAGNRVLSTTWLANPTFFTVYAPVGPLEPKMAQSHFVVNFDAKSNSATDTSLSSPYFPFPGLRNPGAFVLVFRNWDPVKFLLVVGDSTSQEIGSIGCYVEGSGEVWHNLNVDEAYTPSLPLDKDMNDTVLLGLDLDLTGTNKYDHLSPSGEKVEVPPPPIMYAYSSDGTIIGWYVINGTAKIYPGMKNITTESSVDAPMSVTPAPSTMNGAQPPAFGTTQPSTGFGSLGKPPQPAFGSTGFGQSSGQESAFPPGTTAGGFAGFANGGNLSGFSQPSFGQTGFGQSSHSSTFGQAQTPSIFGQPPASTFGQTGQPSVFGQTDQSPSFLKPPSFGQHTFGQTSAFGSNEASGAGFGAFASNNTNFGSPLQAPDSSFGDTHGGPKPSEMIREVSMGIDSGDGGIGSLSLGSGGDSRVAQGKGQGGLFGVVASQPTSTPTTSAFGSSTINPGFGAFSNWNQAKLDTPSPSNAQQDEPKPASGFGQTSFGTKPAPAFGQPAFGSTSTFGQTSFGTPTSSTSITPSSGGFGAWSSSPASLLTSGTSKPTKTAHSSDKGDLQVEPEPEPKPVLTHPEKSDPIAIRDQPKPEPSTPSKSQQEISSLSPASSPGSPNPLAEVGVTPSSPLERSPSPSHFGGSATDNLPPVGGAFANLKQSTFSLGDSVFGAPDKNSPFFKPTQVASPMTPVKVSAFGTPITTSPTPSTTTPVFGRSSVFGQSTPTTPKTPSVPNPEIGGFSAFASTTSPFGKVKGTGTSFSDLLKTPDKAEEPTKPTQRPAVFSLPDPPDRKEPSKTPTNTSPVVPTVFSLAALTPPPDLMSMGLGTSPSDAEHPSGDEYSEDGSSQRSGEGGEEEGNEEEDGEDTEEYGSDSESGSFLDESLSYEDLGAHLDEEEIEGPHELSPVAEETTLPLESGDEGDTTQSPRKKKPTQDPTKIALPISRESSLQPDPRSSSTSPSVTPRPTNAKLPSPEAATVQQSRELSTTPPSTPAKLSSNLPIPSTLSYGIGLGRPSAKPTRSSPLTADPFSGQEASKPPLPAVTPPLPKPRPASPKVAFGQWNTPGLQSKRPDLSKIRPVSLETPPRKGPSDREKAPIFGSPSTLGTISLFGKSGESPTPNLDSAFTPPQPTQKAGLDGERDDPSVQASPSVLLGKSFVSARGTHGGLFGRPTSESLPPRQEAAQTPALSSKLSVPLTAATPDPQVRASHFAIVGERGSSTPPGITPLKPVQQHILEPSLAEGLQAECQYLYLSMNKDIEELKGAAQKMPQRRTELLKPRINSPQPPPGISKNHLEDVQKRSLPDIPAYGKAMKTLHVDIAALKESWGPFHQALGEIEGDMLKASTRKEEIVRFNKAVNNPDFARMLKTRSLGPEHLEKQARLRKQVRSIRDRVEKLESHLHAAKKKLEREKSGKVGFKAPTLDTINRTYRNIDIAIARQMEDINKLSSRLSKLDMNSLQKSKPSSTRDKRLPDRSSKGGKAVNITSSIAAAAATTLNAERSAYRLKNVLLRVRDKPLLNAGASATAGTRVDFKTPQKHSGDFLSSMNGTSMTSLPPLPVTFTPATSSSPLNISGGTRRAKHHAKSAWSSKKPEGESSPSLAPTAFDWGLPPASVCGQKPPPSLPFSLVPSMVPPNSSNKSPGLPFALR